MRCVWPAILLTAGSAFAQVIVPAPVREYLFNGNLTDTQGGPAMQAQGGTVVEGTYVFGAGQGLALIDPSLGAANYSFELAFKFDSLGGYQKVIDFLNRASDTGLYALGSSLNYYTIATAAEADFVAGQMLHLVVTRDAETGQFSSFINGQPRFNFFDTGGLGVISGPNRELYFFMDDPVTGSREAGAGSVDFIRIYNQPLSGAQVLSLFQNGPTAVPEPSVTALLALGLGLLFLRCRALWSN